MLASLHARGRVVIVPWVVSSEAVRVMMLIGCVWGQGGPDGGAGREVAGAETGDAGESDGGVAERVSAGETPERSGRLASPVAPPPATMASSAPPPPASSATAGAPPIDVVITGTRTPEQSQRATVKTDVVSRQELERRGATNVAEALASQPGVQVNPGAYGYLGYVSPIQIQGFDLGRILILEDGEPVIGDVGGGIDLAAIPTGDVERLEIVTGPTSALYGSSALGGVVNVISGPPRADGPSGRVRAEARSRRGVVLQGTGAHRRGRAFVAASVDWNRQDGIPEVPGAPDLRLPSTSRWMAGLRAGARVAAADVQVRGRWLQQRTDGLESQTYPGLGPYLIDSLGRTDRFAGHALGTLRLGRSTQLRLSLAGQWANGRASTIPRGSPLGQTQRTAQEMQSFEATATVADGARTWVGGTRIDLQGARQELDRTQNVNGAPVASTQPELASRRRATAALYGQLQWRLGERLTVLPGLRGEDHGDSGRVMAPRLALALRATDSLILRASAGRGFRAPSPKELGFDFDHSVYGYRVVGNPALGSERSWGTNGDVTWTVAAPVTLRAGTFMNWVDDLIDIDLAGGNSSGMVVTYSYKNFARVRTLGAQGGLTAQAGARLRLDLTYDYLWTRDDVSLTPIAGRPAHTLTVAGQASLPARLEVSARARVVSGGFVDGTSRSPGYQTVDVRIARPIVAGTLAYAGVLNLLDAHQDPGRVGDLRPPAGRVLYVGLRADLPAESN